MESIPFIKKFLHSILDIPFMFERKKNPILLMTIQVKNEADIIEKNLRFHKAMGVDGFIITDNNSTDNTLNILKKYKKKGWVLELIEEKRDGHFQKQWVDRMIWLAKTKHQADWVINADADEFWFLDSGNLKDEIRRIDRFTNVLECQMHSVLPEENKDLSQWDKVVSVIEDYEKYNLSKYSIFAPVNHKNKIMNKTKGYLQISSGNHKVLMLFKKKVKSNIFIFHYTTRGKEHFFNKVINGGKQIEKNPSKHCAIHWKYFYALYKQGFLYREYDKVIGANTMDILEKNGFIRKDERISDFFSKHNI